MAAIPALSPNRKKRFKKLRSKKHRDREGLFLAEGLNALREALKENRYPLKAIIVAADAAKGATEHLLLQTALTGDIPLYSCSRETLRELSTEEQPQGIILVCETRTYPLDSMAGGTQDRMIYLDGVSDPGNLGSIMRTALWFGVDHILMGPSCVDPFNTKVIRSSAGALFGMSIVQAVDTGDILNLARRGGWELVATAPRGGEDPGSIKKCGKYIFLLGNESRGLSPELMDQADRTITIPGRGGAESLNLAAAAAILLYATGGTEH
ncbi:MAG: RNA methyltransferase [Syntrophales bacterium]|jgi:TrmH family RNA methyltransferase|nr:RNA methyltransferase [Syntrophales bacterium]MCK9527917.1 RNA methyltransferase [Syntrophales bacterium]MDX9921907.1 RNA methyltransferase [Syntrophales bacterium]